MSALGDGARARNGGAQGPVPVIPQQQNRVPTPTEILRRRRERDARAQEAKETEQREIAEIRRMRQEEEEEEQERRRAEEQRRLSAERRAAGAVGTGGSGYVDPSRRSGGARRSGGEVAGAQESSDRRRTSDRPTSDAVRQSREGGAQATLSSAAQTSNLPQPVPRTRAASSTVPQPRPSQAQPGTRATSAGYGSGQEQQSQTRLATAQGGTSRAPGGTSAAASLQKQQPSQPTPARNGNASSFPHAFERWEQLSSHWEGLTSYWIKRLEGNADELSGQHINQQLARQVTDLSAAGANLFHAVVELQRLRASSERKFQRWFFETRSEQEKSQERIAQLEKELRQEKQLRADESANGTRRGADAATLEEALKIKRQADMIVKEKERELQISRDEARRGWEEIGRMEQAERDRTFSLKRGQATLVGGVQVVPMAQQGLSRQASSHSGHAGGLTSHPVGQQDNQAEGYRGYNTARSDTDTDPYSESARDRDVNIPPVPRVPEQAYTQTSASSAAAAQTAHAATAGSRATSSQEDSAHPITSTSNSMPPPPLPQSSSGGFYQHHGSATALHEDVTPPPAPGPPHQADDARSYVPSLDDAMSDDEYELDEYGHVRRDANNKPILYRRGPASEDSDEYNVDDQLRQEQMYGRHYGGASGSGVRTTNGQGDYTSAPDYSGSGYGGWEAMPRHHHPTRLSDVLEEDERSRTSPSRASERSRGVF